MRDTLKQIAKELASAAAHGAGGVLGVRIGNDLYNAVKSGDAKRAVKRIAGKMADAAGGVLPRKEEPVLRSAPADFQPPDGEEASVRPARRRTSEAERVQVECERCGRPAAVQPRSGDVIVTCATCKARFWIDTDQLAQRMGIK